MADIDVTIGANASQYKKEVNSASATFSNFVVTTNQGLELISKAFSALRGVIQGPLEAFRQAELATNQLRLALENQGLEVDALADSYGAIAKELQKKTGVDDDAIKSSTALLQSFVGQRQISRELIATMVDLAERTGSLDTAAEILGKGIQGNTKGLRQFGVEINASGTQAQRTEEIIAKLGTRVGGLAESAGRGLGGFRGLQSAFSDLQETLGEQLAPAVSDVVAELTTFINEIAEDEAFKTLFADLARDVGQLAVSFIKLVEPATKALGAIRDFGKNIGGSIAEFFAPKLDPSIKVIKATGDATVEATKQTNQKLETEDDRKRKAAAKRQADEDAAKKNFAESARVADEEALQASLLQNEQFQALSKEQQTLFLEQKQEELLKANQTQLEAEFEVTSQLLAEESKRNNQLLQERARYGAAIAAIDNVINSKQVQGVKTATGQLVALQNSKSQELKTIGKAAAIAQITIATAESATNIFKGFSAIPFVGVPLGIAGAAAAVAFGAEQIATVVAAQQGGVVPGLNKGFDSVPALLQPGELVVPRNNFSDVVGAVADRRAQEEGRSASFSTTPGTGSSVTARLEFSGDGAEKFLTARQVEARSLGTLQEAS